MLTGKQCAIKAQLLEYRRQLCERASVPSASLMVGIEISTGIPDSLIDRVVQDYTQVQCTDDLIKLGVTSSEHADVFFDIITRGNRTPGSRVATPVATRHSEAKYCNSFQLTHRPRGNDAQSIASNGDQKENKTLLQHAQLSQHGEFRHVNVSERQRSHLCGQNLCGAFVRAVLATNFEESDRAMAADGTTKALVSPPPR